MTSPESTSDETSYLDDMRSQVPNYDRLQAAAIEAIPFEPQKVLELGIGTGQTCARLLERFPSAQITGLDRDPEMVFRAREQISDVKLARMEDPLPDGPWDLIISVLSIHRLSDDQKKILFRRVRQQSRALVIGDFVSLASGEGESVVPGEAYPDTASELEEWSGGDVKWSCDDLVVIAADYR